jgi:hypothetical protein
MDNENGHMQCYFNLIAESKSGHAWLFDDGVNRVWLPRSQIQVARIPGPSSAAVVVSLPTWLAKKKGII